jgi:hypothetical protein
MEAGMTLERFRLLLLLVAIAPALVSAQLRSVTLGSVLDAGAKRVAAEEFRRELVGRPVFGLSATGSSDLEFVYVANGTIQGAFTQRYQGAGGLASGSIAGAWKIDRSDRICTTMQIGSGFLPERCEYWFKLGDEYMLSTSDSDREARVAKRALKR